MPCLMAPGMNAFNPSSNYFLKVWNKSDKYSQRKEYKKGIHIHKPPPPFRGCWRDREVKSPTSRVEPRLMAYWGSVYIGWVTWQHG